MNRSLVALILPTNPTEFWTLVTGVGTLVVAWVARQGLRSLGLTRRDMVTRATRESRTEAIRRAEEWAARIIPENAAILKQFAEHKVPVFVRGPNEVRFDGVDHTYLRSAADWCQKLPPGVAEKCLTLLNSVEAWSMYFMSGLADPALAFGPCAPTFCSLVVQTYPMLLVVRTGQSSGKFPNTVQLFKGWLAKLEEEKRGIQAGNLLKQLRELQTKGPASADLLPEPLGTNLD